MAVTCCMVNDGQIGLSGVVGLSMISIAAIFSQLS